MKRRSAPVLALVLIAALVAFGPTLPAEAHANLVESTPPANAVLTGAPAEIHLVFSEEPELTSTEVSVLNQNGEHVENHDLHKHSSNTVGLTVPALPDGTYTVVWKTTSAVDGHPTAGTFAFGINVAPSTPGGAADQVRLNGPPRWLSFAARLLTYIPLFVLLGAVAFPLLVLGPASSRRPPGEDQLRSAASTASAILGASATLLVCGTLLTIVLQAWSSAGSGAASTVFGRELPTVIRHTRFGHVWLARAALTAAAFVAAMAFSRRWEDAVTSRRPTAPSLALLIVGLTLPLTVSLNSHSAAEQDLTWLTTGADWLHLVVAGLWIGGLVQFVFVVPAMTRSMEQDRRAALLAAAIPRFSTLAILSVTTLVATGIFQWWMLVGGFDDTLYSAYGQAIIVKVVLLALLLGLGALNLLILGPGLRRRVHSVGDAVVAAAPVDLMRRFGRTVRTEVTIALCVIGAAAFLTTGSPPFHFPGGAASTAGSGTIVQRQSAGDVDITLSIDPGVAGPNVIDFFLKDAPSSDHPIQRFVIRFTYLADQLGTTEDDATAMHPTHYELTGSQLSLPGRWRLEVIVRRGGLEDVRTSFEVSMPLPPSPTRSPAPLATLPPGGQELRIGASASTSFDTGALTAKPGAVSIEFTNSEQGVSHNFHLFSGRDASGVSVGATSLARGPDVQRLELTLDEGSYYYLCDVHPAMHGVLTVTAP